MYSRASSKCESGSAEPQKRSPTPIPAAKSMASQLTVENSGSSSSLPSLILPYREKASQIQRIKRRLAESMTNQPRLVNIMPVRVEENLASPAVSTIPHTAIRPVKVSAMSSSGFLNTLSPFRQQNSFPLILSTFRCFVKKRISLKRWFANHCPWIMLHTP